ncbi:MAG: hypothetical protein M3253_00305 [Chloroflexota bacterium]|nr:hypothetical protein [Chloroflexota bacterium]
MSTGPAHAAQRAAAPRTGGRSLTGRLLAGVLRSASAVLGQLPDRLLHRAAHGAGWLLYLLWPNRRALVRRNLARVCSYLVDQRLVEAGSAAALAARDEHALERLVRQAFGHYVRGYLEVTIVAAYARRGHDELIELDEPSLLTHAFGPPGGETGPLIVVALHFGAIELPGVWAARRGLRVTAPMETLHNPDLQAYLVQSRSASGLRLVAAHGAGRQLVAALEHGEVVAIVADRVVAGAGARTQLFGAPTRLPLGPAVLALESGARAWLVAVRRTGWGRYRAHLEHIEMPPEGNRRERLSRFLDAQARAFERAVAAAPEQWWALFFPIWLEKGAGGGAT